MGWLEDLFKSREVIAGEKMGPLALIRTETLTPEQKLKIALPRLLKVRKESIALRIWIRALIKTPSLRVRVSNILDSPWGRYRNFSALLADFKRMGPQAAAMLTEAKESGFLGEEFSYTPAQVLAAYRFWSEMGTALLAGARKISKATGEPSPVAPAIEAEPPPEALPPVPGVPAERFPPEIGKWLMYAGVAFLGLKALKIIK